MRRLMLFSLLLAAIVILAWPRSTPSEGAVSARAHRPDLTGRNQGPVVGFSNAIYSADEREEIAAIRVALDAAPAVTVTAHYVTADGSAVAGSDYVSASGTLTFTPGMISQTFSVPIIDDELDEADETVALGLVNLVNGTVGELSAATLFILDDDGVPSVRFSAADYSASEAVREATISVTLSNAYSLTVNVAYETSDGSALAGSDYVTSSGRLTFTAGITLQSFTVPLLDDELPEVRETVRLSLRKPENGTLGLFRSATLTILDDEEFQTFLPLVARNRSWAYVCPTISANTYISGTAFQEDTDNPVRLAHDHADKNIELRGYVANTDPNLKRELVNLGSDDPTQPPQLATLFSPHRVPAFGAFYQIHDWLWGSAPDPGTRGDPVTTPPVTALGMETTPGETLHVPVSGYDIGGFEVIVLFADEDTVALRYGRKDSAAPPGYTLHIDNICTDPNLLALYNALDAPDGPRYVYMPQEERPYSYPLPTLEESQPIGRARDSEIVVVIVDTGTAQDTRSCNEWWQVRSGYGGACPQPRQ